MKCVEVVFNYNYHFPAPLLAFFKNSLVAFFSTTNCFYVQIIFISIFSICECWMVLGATYLLLNDVSKLSIFIQHYFLMFDRKSRCEQTQRIRGKKILKKMKNGKKLYVSRAIFKFFSFLLESFFCWHFSLNNIQYT